MTMGWNLLPFPRKIIEKEGNYPLTAGKLVVMNGKVDQLSFSARRFQQALMLESGLAWSLQAGWAVPQEEIGLLLRIDPIEVVQAEGYQLSITPQMMQIVGHDPAGVFYGVCTLIQLLQQSENCALTCMTIEDYPDFPARGVMLDISRDKVYKMETLYELIDRLSGWKINQLQLYTEHTFAYRNHPEVWSKASPVTGEEILALDAYCRERFIELVPNQNLFGHMERWLKHPRYAPLAEVHGEFAVPWGTMKGPFSLSPVNPGSLELAEGLLDELLPHFSSRTVNIGCDETFDLGQGQSKAACDQKGEGRVYLDYLLKLYANVSRRGFRTQFWGDIINQHPELVPELPRDMIGLLWGYEAEFPFGEQGERFAQAGVPFYVCPGTSAWNTLAGRTKNTLGNLLSAAENGLKYGACGYLNTDWGDNGHWQAIPISWLGFAAGAAYSWCLASNREMDLSTALSWYGFDDRSGAMGKLAFELGNAYLETGFFRHNSAVFFHLLQRSLPEIVKIRGIQNAKLSQALEAIDCAAEHIAQENMTRADAPVIRCEFKNTIRMMRHACLRGFLAFEGDPVKVDNAKKELAFDLAEIVDEYRALWLERNRPGGLEDSLARFENARRDYA
jgi:hypothetical protein